MDDRDGDGRSETAPGAQRDEVFPTSGAEQRLAAVCLAEPEDPYYNLLAAARIRGPLRLGALSAAVRSLIERHEVLRAAYRKQEGKLTRVISARIGEDQCLRSVDLRRLAGEHDALAARLGRQLAGRPFDLRRGGLARFLALTVARDEHLVLLVLHHVIADAWTIDLLFQELAELYGQRVTGGERLRSPAAQISDAVATEERWQASSRARQAATYWRERLRGYAATTLPGDAPGQAPTHRGHRAGWTLPDALAERLRHLARERRVTLFPLFAAAFLVTLHRATRERRLLVGTNISTRDFPGAEGIAGLCLNLVGLAAEITGETTFDELIHTLKQHMAQALSSSRFPLAAALESEARGPTCGILPIVFNFSRRSANPFPAAGVASEAIELESGLARFALSCIVVSSGDEIRLRIDADQGLYRRATVRALLDLLRTTLTVLAEHPAVRLSEALAKAPPADGSLLFGPAIEAIGSSIDAAFYHIASRHPDRVAVIDAARSLSYAGLAVRSRCIAAALVQRGVAPGERVALLATRSADLPACLLGILAAGAAYVPLAPEWPEQRHREALRQLGCACLLVGGRPHRVPDFGLPMLYAQEIWEASDVLPGDPPGSRPDAVAYAILTSGSSGRPKAVEVEHRHLLTYLRGMLDALRLAAAKRWLLLSTPVADLSNTILYGALLSGGTLCVVERQIALDAAALRQTRDRLRAEIVKITPSHLALLLAQGWRGELAHDLLISGGEALSWELVSELRHRGLHGAIANHYGPTETTVGVLVHRLEASRGATTGDVPLGRPLAGVGLAIVDPYLVPLPVSLAGEILIGGATVARGYAGEPERERFLDPFPALRSRAYRTGDLGRLNAEGLCEFLGRIDEEIKLRGFRVHPREVERVLEEHSAVARAAAVPVEGDGAGLVAFCVLTNSTAVTPDTLRDMLRRRLPEHLVPKRVSISADLPLTPAGKVDRAALRARAASSDRGVTGSSHGGAQLAAAALISAACREHPQSEAERAAREHIASCWQTALGHSDFTHRDKFNEVGGDSLTMVQVFAELKRTWASLRIANLYTHNTIEALARWLVELPAQR